MANGLLSNPDPMTGLKRREHCDFESEKMLSDSETDISFVFIDIDEFKRINDILGHETGDEIIKEIAANLNGIDAKKEVYRYGGEEYLIVLPGIPKEDAFLMMEDIRKNIKGENCVKTSANRIRDLTLLELGQRKVLTVQSMIMKPMEEKSKVNTAIIQF